MLLRIVHRTSNAGKGFHVPPSGDGADTEVPFLTPSRLPAARNALAMLLGLMFHAAWRKCRTEKTQELETYARFCDILGQLMQDEGLRFAVAPDVIGSRSFYLISEAAAQRLNDPQHVVDRRVRLGKFYMPHGCLSWRDCPNCGRVTVCLGDEWRPDSDILLPPAVIAIPGANHQRPSDCEDCLNTLQRPFVKGRRGSRSA